MSGSKCYGLMTIPKTWWSAEDDCVSQGGHLASITSDSENSVVYDLRGNLTSQFLDIWIGLSDTVRENKFRWIDDDTVSYTMWDNGEPNNRPFQGDCVRMVSSGKWSDTPCWRHRQYVCETSSQPASPPIHSATIAATTSSATTSATTPAHLGTTSAHPATTSPSTPASTTSGKTNMCLDL